MRLPLTLHPSNHLPAQCLLLHAALHSDNPPGPHAANQRSCYAHIERLARCRTVCTVQGRNSTFLPTRMAALLRWAQAQSHVAGASTMSGPPERPNTSTSTPIHCPTQASATTTTTTIAAHRVLSRMPPPAVIARYGPRVLVRELRHLHTDLVSYDAAVHHAALLTALMQPYGLQVAMTGLTRRGAPLAPHAEFLLCLSPAATRAVLAVHRDSGDPADIVQAAAAEDEDREAADPRGVTALMEGERRAHDRSRGGGAACEAPEGRHLHKPRAPPPPPPPSRSLTAVPAPRTEPAFLRDDLMIRPWQTSPSSHAAVRGSVAGGPASADAAAGTADTSAQRTSTSPPSPAPSSSASSCTSPPSLNSALLQERLPRQRQHRYDAFAPHDAALTAPVCFRIRRAMGELVRAGFVVGAGGRAFPPSPARLRARAAVNVVVRYDPRRPSQVPPSPCTDAATLARLQLHLLRLHFCSCDAFHARQFFYTGPAAFTAHVTLQALARGVDVNVNGVFCATAPARTDVAADGARGPEDGGRDAADTARGSHDGGAGAASTTAAPRPPAVADADGEVAVPQQHDDAASVRSTAPPHAVPSASPPASAAAGKAKTAAVAADHDVVEQLMVESEDDIMTLADVPLVDAALRGVYCQTHNL